MEILTAAVVIVGVLCLLDLVLTLGVVRRLREHNALLVAGARGPSAAITALQVGQKPGAFSVTTVDGPRVSGPAGLRLVAFFSTHCSACPERVPPLVEYLASNAISRESVLTVIEGGEFSLPAYFSGLSAVSQVCAGSDGDLVFAAFQASGYPAFCLLNGDGTLVASGIHPEMLTESVGV